MITSGGMVRRGDRVIMPFRGLGTVLSHSYGDEGWQTNGSIFVKLDTGKCVTAHFPGHRQLPTEWIMKVPVRESDAA